MAAQRCKAIFKNEVTDALNIVSASVDPEADIIYGTAIDEKLDEEIRVTVMATRIRPVKKIYTREYLKIGNIALES